MAGSNIAILEEILQFFTGMAEEINHLALVESVFNGSDMVIPAIEAVYVAIIKFWVNAITYYRNRMRTDFKSRIKTMLSSSRIMSEEFIKLKGNIAAQRTRLHEVSATQHQAQQREISRKARRKELFKWIDAPHYEHDLRTANGLRHSGTCKWFRGKQQYVDWLESRTSPMLVILGTAGMGKTILSSWLLDEARSHPSDHITLYHFFKETDDNKNSPLAATRSLLDQLYDWSLSIDSPVVEVIESQLDAMSHKHHIDFEPLWNILSSLLCKCCQFARPHTAFVITVVLDAMDECKDSKKLVHSLHKLVHDASNRIHVIITSRPSGAHIDEFWRPYPNQPLPAKLELTQEDAKTDITTFVAHSVYRIERFDDRRYHALRDRIITVFSDVKNHQGMFLWAYLMCKEVEYQIEVSKIWRLLERLPEGLDGMYMGICTRLAGMDKTSLEFCRLILRWIVASRRPMTFAELEEALKAMPADDGDLKFFDEAGGLLWSRRDIVRCCGDLVRYTGLSEGDTIGIVHLSAQQFLSTHISIFSRQYPGNASTVSEFFHVDISSMELQIAMTCIEYILSTSPHAKEYASSHICKGLDSTTNQVIFKQRYPLFNYAIIYWPEYALNVLQSQAYHAIKGVQRFITAITAFTLSPIYVIWLEEFIHLTYVEFAQYTIRRFLELDDTVVSPDILHQLYKALLDFSRTLSSHPQMVKLCVSRRQPIPYNPAATSFNSHLPSAPADCAWIGYDPSVGYIFSSHSVFYEESPPALECQVLKTGLRLRPLQVPSEIIPEGYMEYHFYSGALSASRKFIAVTYECTAPAGGQDIYLTICWSIGHFGTSSGMDDWATLVFSDHFKVDEKATFVISPNCFGFVKGDIVFTPHGLFNLHTKQRTNRLSTIFGRNLDIHRSLLSRGSDRVARIEGSILEVDDHCGAYIYRREFGPPPVVKLCAFSDTGNKLVVFRRALEKSHISSLLCIIVDEAKQISMPLTSESDDPNEHVRDPLFTKDEGRLVAKSGRKLAVWAFLQNEDGSYDEYANMIFIFADRSSHDFVFDLIPEIWEDSNHPVEDALIIDRYGHTIRRPLTLELQPHEQNTPNRVWVIVWKSSFPEIVIWSIERHGLLRVDRWLFGSSGPTLISHIEEQVPVVEPLDLFASPDGNYLAADKIIVYAHATPNRLVVYKLDLPQAIKYAAFNADGTLFAACVRYDSTNCMLHVFDIPQGPQITRRASYTLGMIGRNKLTFSKCKPTLVAIGSYIMKLEDRRLLVNQSDRCMLLCFNHDDKSSSFWLKGIRGFSECGLYYYDAFLKLNRLPGKSFVPHLTSPIESTSFTLDWLTDSHVQLPHIVQLRVRGKFIYLRHRLVSESNDMWRSRMISVLPDSMSWLDKRRVNLLWPQGDIESLKFLVEEENGLTLVDTGISKGELIHEWSVKPSSSINNTTPNHPTAI